jgi:nitrate reductase delta subunit
MNVDIYNSLAALLSYPGEDYDRRTHDALNAIANRKSAIGNELAEFAEAMRPMRAHEIQELFIQTFDLNPVCSLEMGWHLFGENYDRGLLLVKMRQQLRAHGIAETTELPDHLTNGLRLLARTERGEGAYFAEAIVLPALEKMLEAIRGKNNPCEHVLNAARLAVCEDFPHIPEHRANETRAKELKVLAQ